MIMKSLSLVLVCSVISEGPGPRFMDDRIGVVELEIYGPDAGIIAGSITSRGDRVGMLVRDGDEIQLCILECGVLSPISHESCVVSDALSSGVTSVHWTLNSRHALLEVRRPVQGSGDRVPGEQCSEWYSIQVPIESDRVAPKLLHSCEDGDAGKPYYTMAGEIRFSANLPSEDDGEIRIYPDRRFIPREPEVRSARLVDWNGSRIGALLVDETTSEVACLRESEVVSSVKLDGVVLEFPVMIYRNGDSWVAGRWYPDGRGDDYIDEIPGSFATAVIAKEAADIRVVGRIGSARLLVWIKEQDASRLLLVGHQQQ